MVEPRQARDRIWQSIMDHGGPVAVSAKTRPAPTKKNKTPEPAVSSSMLYKFKGATKQLGPDSVNALAPILTDIDAGTWLVAMGVDVASEASP